MSQSANLEETAGDGDDSATGSSKQPEIMKNEDIKEMQMIDLKRCIGYFYSFILISLLNFKTKDQIIQLQDMPNPNDFTIIRREAFLLGQHSYVTSPLFDNFLNPVFHHKLI